MKTHPSTIAIALIGAAIGCVALIAPATPNQKVQTASLTCVNNMPTPFVNAAVQRQAVDPAAFYYNVQSRFMSSITLEQAQNATSIEELLPNQSEGITKYERVDLIEMDRKYNTINEAKGTESVFTAAQLEFLRALNYSSNFRCEVAYQGSNETLRMMTPHLTVVPEKEAHYVRGKDALIDHLKRESSAAIASVQKNRIQSGRIYFTIGATGVIEKVETIDSCGYPVIDARMFQLIKELPGAWEAAENSSGKPVAQEFVFTYGNEGC